MAGFDAHSVHISEMLNANDVSAPLESTVICCTSVPDEKRTQLAGYAQEMGAIHRYDLTLDVTHLIVGDHNTPKYQYVAKERPDVRPMTIEWIEALRDLWINDKEIDLEELEKEYALPTFHALRFSMTGCDDPAERLEIAETVKAHGATYEGDLTKHITHLISFRTEGAKYKAAKSWGLKIVSPEWLNDSLERGMILDEQLYDPALPLEERGKGAWDRTKPKMKRTSLGKRSRTDGASLEGSKRKLRRTANNKLNGQNDNLWGDIVGGGMIAQVARSGVWETNEKECLPQKGTLDDPNNSGSIQSTLENPPLPKGIFSGCRFLLYGFPSAKSQILQGHLVNGDGEVSNTIEELIAPEPANSSKRFRVIPQDLHISEHPPLPEDSGVTIQTVTFWWVERCLHHKKFFDPSEHIIGRPFPVFPIEGFSTLFISTSAFSGIDFLHVTRAIGLIGATYSEDMTPKSSVVVTRTLTAIRRDKFDSAQEWNIPIVSAEWLWDSIKAGKQLSMSNYRCRPLKRHDSLPSTSHTIATKIGSQLERSKSEIKKASSTNSQVSKAVTKTHEPPKSLLINTSTFECAVKPSDAAVTLPEGSQVSKTVTKASRSTWLDGNAFSNDEPVLKEELDTQKILPLTLTSNPETQDPSTCKTEPLSERSSNSSSKTVSTAPAPSGHPTPKPREDLSSTISDLLAKTKTAAVQPAQNDQPEVRKRGRILGRVTSNLSTGSGVLSTATSADSTATHGNPVEYPPPISLSDKTANEKIQMLMNGDKYTGKDLDSQPPPTQLQYDDPDSTEARENMLKRMKGEKIEKRTGLREKAVTLGDFREKPTRTTRRAVKNKDPYR